MDANAKHNGSVATFPVTPSAATPGAPRAGGVDLIMRVVDGKVRVQIVDEDGEGVVFDGDHLVALESAVSAAREYAAREWEIT